MQNILEQAIEKAFYDLSLDPFDDQQIEEFLKSLNVPKKGTSKSPREAYSRTRSRTPTTT